MPVKVYLRHGEHIESALRKFKKLCEREGIVKEMKKHSYYEKPSDLRRRAKHKAFKNAQQQNLISLGLIKPNEVEERPKKKYPSR